MTAPDGRKANPFTVADLRNWRTREQDLLDGAVIPSLRDRYNGHSAFRCSALLDLRQVVDLEVERDRLPSPLLAALRELAIVPTGTRCWTTSELVADVDSDLSSVLLWHAAIRGNEAAMQELRQDTLFDRRPHDRMGWSHMCAMVLGLQVLVIRLRLDDSDTEAVDVAEAREIGFEKLEMFGDLAGQRAAATEALDTDEQTVASGMLGALAAMRAAQENDLNSVEDMLDDAREKPVVEVQPASMVVVAGDPEIKPSGARADVFKSMKAVIGAQLRLITTDQLATARTELHARYPHMHVEIDAILATQSALRVARLAVLLVGEPGYGKTTFARDLADLLGIPAMVYSCAGASDGAFGGTSAQWNSARSSTPLQHVARTLVANPLIVLDEVDKIGSNRHNGSLADTLLSFLEPTSSRAFHDLALEQTVDLSAVSYVATANVLEDVSVALRDRFKIVRIPPPGFEHVGVLSERIIADLARDRGLDRRWIEPLAQDEADLVRKAWSGGSLRTLTRIVTMLVDGRDSQMGRA